jgi:hypothetical protein
MGCGAKRMGMGRNGGLTFSKAKKYRSMRGRNLTLRQRQEFARQAAAGLGGCCPGIGQEQGQCCGPKPPRFGWDPKGQCCPALPPGEMGPPPTFVPPQPPYFPPTYEPPTYQPPFVPPQPPYFPPTYQPPALPPGMEEEPPPGCPPGTYMDSAGRCRPYRRPRQPGVLTAPPPPAGMQERPTWTIPAAPTRPPLMFQAMPRGCVRVDPDGRCVQCAPGWVLSNGMCYPATP